MPKEEVIVELTPRKLSSEWGFTAAHSRYLICNAQTQDAPFQKLVILARVLILLEFSPTKVRVTNYCQNTLSDFKTEIMEVISDGDGIPYWDEVAAVNYMVYDDDQWISYDDNNTFQQKVKFANEHCLGGVMI
jgi:hypothetical protein